MVTTGFYWDEACFWHGGGGNYAFVAPAGGLVQPMAAGGLPESPETKRRLINLIRRTGLYDHLRAATADPAEHDDLLRIHPERFLAEFKRVSDSGGGEIGIRTPFGPGGFEIATQSAGLVKRALFDVLDGTRDNAYALSRPPGHHAMPELPMGFCLLANAAIAIEAAIAAGKCERVAVIDWDVHHGNGTEAIFIDRPDVLTVSIHQEFNFPRDTGQAEVRGEGPGKGFNLNIPVPPGAGHDTYLYAFDQLIEPAVRAFDPDVIVVACGFDGGLSDPLSRTVLSVESFRELTERTIALAADCCDGKLVLEHEGGYSELHVPFCGHAVIDALCGAGVEAPDPMFDRGRTLQPSDRVAAFFRQLIDEQVAALR